MSIQYDRILVPTDGSPEAEAAIAHAVELATRYGATLYALSVVDVSHFKGLDSDTSVIVDGFEEEAERTLAQVRDSGESVGVPVETAVRHGPVGETILEYADEVAVDLMVLGTRGKHSIDQFLIASVAERVLRHASVPVLTVRVED